MNIGGLTESGNEADRSGNSAGRRGYHSPRRQQQATETRAAIAAAARDLFATHGWGRTRVRDVAHRAGVAEPTVYAAYGSKAGLARALVDAVELSADVPDSAARLISSTAGPADQLASLAHYDRRLFERGGDVIALLRQAGDSEPDLRTAYQQGRARADQLRRAVFASWPPETFRDNADPNIAADTFAAISNIDVYRVLTEERGWSPDQIEQWWSDTLTHLILR